MKIKRNDMVVVISGDSAGPTPHKVVQVLAADNKLVIEGINRVFKHVKRGHPKSPQGGRLQVEMPIHMSNVMYYCESCAKPARLGYRYTTEGAKERHCRKCGSSAGQVSPPRAAYAK